ncbi:ubiquitin-protein ligase peroxin 12 [Sorochytrium milnesiophthora]
MLGAVRCQPPQAEQRSKQYRYTARDIPTEILLSLFERLGTRELISCARVNSGWWYAAARVLYRKIHIGSREQWQVFVECLKRSAQNKYSCSAEYVGELELDKSAIISSQFKDEFRLLTAACKSLWSLSLDLSLIAKVLLRTDSTLRALITRATQIDFHLSMSFNNTFGLRRLRIRNGYHITDSSILYLVSTNPKLTDVALEQCNLLTGRAVLYIAQYLGSSLQSLCLNRCLQIQVDDLAEFACCQTPLERLEMGHYRKVVLPSSLRHVLPLFPRLTGLSLARSALTNECIQVIAKLMGPRLLWLNLNHCVGLEGDQFLLPLAQHCRNLHTLRLYCCMSPASPRLRELRDASAASRPTLFELIAQDQLSSSLGPAVQYVIATLAHRYPRRLLRVLAWHDEVFSAIMLIVDSHYLKTFGGSFTENFYGFKRIRVLKVNRADKLTNGDINRSLVGLVAVPWLAKKLHEQYQTINNSAAALFGEEEDDDQHDEDDLGGNDLLRKYPRLLQTVIRLRKRLRTVFRAVYPWLYFAARSSQLAYRIGYTYGLTDYYSPILHILRLRIVRLTMDDQSQYLPIESDEPQTLLQRAWQQLLNALKIGLPLSIFAYKFLEWWYTHDFTKEQKKAIPVPPPPQRIMPHPDAQRLPESVKECPICRTSIVNPAALPTGYVFCYKCIFAHVQDHAECPVTRVPAVVDDIRKIYETDG